MVALNEMSHLDGIVAALSHDAPTVRAAAAGAAGQHGSPRALRALAALLMDDDLSVRRAAASALFPHAGEDIRRYDPAASKRVREPIADRVRARYED